MSDMTETLQQLVERRLREMGKRRGRGENLSLREAWLRLPEGDDGQRPVSYETVRRIREQGHTNIGRATAVALATMLDMPVEDIQTAAGQRPEAGPFVLPARADRLNPSERQVVLAVVDAILDASGGAPDRRTEPKSPRAVPERPDSEVTELSERRPRVPEKRVARRPDKKK